MEKTVTKKEILNISLSVLFFIALILLIITFSIGLPIYFRPFYYVQINLRNMTEYTGWSYEVIKEAYDEVLNFLCFGTEFGTGELLYSESGKSHFEDCKILFDLNITVFLISFPIVVTLFILNKKKVIEIKKLWGFNPSFYSAIFTILIPVIVGILAVIDFDTAFKVFHQIFFPGKSNWYFDPRTDQIIMVMPQEFFGSCAALIGASLLIITISIIVFEIIRKNKLSKA